MALLCGLLVQPTARQRSRAGQLMADRLDWVFGSGMAAVAQPCLVQRKISLNMAFDAVSRSPTAQHRLGESHATPDS